MSFAIDTYSTDELKNISKKFCSHLAQAKAGLHTDFAYLKTQLSSHSLVKEKEVFQIFTIGGSNFVSCQANYQNKKLVIQKYAKKPLPLFHTKQIFLDFIISSIPHDIDIVAINFGYPIRSLFRNKQLEAIMLHGTKEHQFEGLVGMQIGKEIEDYTFEKLGKKVKIAIANDIVCLLANSTEDVAALIVGTGYNLGIKEDSNIFINLESGNFSDFRRTDTGIKIDKTSQNRGKQLFEKEVAGAYLYQHYNLIAAELGLPPTESTVSMAHIADKKSGNESLIASQIFTRSASLVACQIAGLYSFRKKTKLKLIIQGGIFWKNSSYKDQVYEFLSLIGLDSKNVQIVKADDNLTGTGRLVSDY